MFYCCTCRGFGVFRIILYAFNIFLCLTGIGLLGFAIFIDFSYWRFFIEADLRAFILSTALLQAIGSFLGLIGTYQTPAKHSTRSKNYILFIYCISMFAVDIIQIYMSKGVFEVYRETRTCSTLQDPRKFCCGPLESKLYDLIIENPDYWTLAEERQSCVGLQRNDSLSWMGPQQFARTFQNDTSVKNCTSTSFPLPPGSWFRSQSMIEANFQFNKTESYSAYPPCCGDIIVSKMEDRLFLLAVLEIAIAVVMFTALIAALALCTSKFPGVTIEGFTPDGTPYTWL